jgi:RND family efflux transporter MFP subunit
MLPVLAGCEQSETKAQGAPPPPPAVTVAKPTKKVVAEYDEYVGRFVAVDAVEVRARVSGYLDKVHFQDGQIVKQGDLLFTIDRRPFLSAVDQARGSLAQAQANLAYAESDLARAEGLVRGSTITQQTYDQRVQARRVAQAAVQAGEAAVRQAELDLEFTELRAPVTGRIGDRRVSPGNLVAGGSTGATTLLATIVSLDPIRFEFTLDESSYLRYVRMPNGATGMASGNTAVQVQLKLIDEQGFTHNGRMDFVDNAIDRSTGTIRGRAVFDNPDGVFTPGMFARIRVPSSPPEQKLLVAEAAIGTEQANKFVLIVDGENTARPRYVTLGALVDGMRIVRNGLTETDRVIVNGLMRARPGTKVTPIEQTAQHAPAGAAKSTD